MSVGAMISRKMCEHRAEGRMSGGAMISCTATVSHASVRPSAEGAGVLCLAPSRLAWVCAGVRLKHTHRSARRHVTHVCCAIVVFFSVRTGGERVLGIPAARLTGRVVAELTDGHCASRP